MKEEKQKLYRQGDILIRRIQAMPAQNSNNANPEFSQRVRSPGTLTELRT